MVAAVVVGPVQDVALPVGDGRLPRPVLAVGVPAAAHTVQALGRPRSLGDERLDPGDEGPRRDAEAVGQLGLEVIAHLRAKVSVDAGGVVVQVVDEVVAKACLPFLPAGGEPGEPVRPVPGGVLGPKLRWLSLNSHVVELGVHHQRGVALLEVLPLGRCLHTVERPDGEIRERESELRIVPVLVRHVDDLVRDVLDGN